MTKNRKKEFEEKRMRMIVNENRKLKNKER